MKTLFQYVQHPSSRHQISAYTMNLHNHALRLLLAGMSCAGLCESPALAQSVPGIGNVLRQAEPAKPATGSPRKEEPSIETREAAPMHLPAGKTLMVRTFIIEGADGLAPEKSLQQLLDPYRGRALDMAQINAAASRITAELRRRGYLVARAYVPRQDATSGTLRLKVIPGHFGRLTLRNKSLVDDAILTALFTPATRGPAIERQALERAMLLIDDLPGTPLPRLLVSPGEEPGSSDFLLDTGSGKRLEGYLVADNLGSRYTGKYRQSTGLDINAPSGRGDRFSISAMNSSGGGLNNARATYSLPLGSSGLRAEVSASNTTYTLGGDYAALDATGNARSLEANLSLPLQRTRDESWWASLGVASRQLKDEIKAADSTTPKTSHAITLTTRRESWKSLFGHPLHMNWLAGMSYGELRIDDPDQVALNRAGANTIGHFGKISATLQNSLEFGHKWHFTLGMSAQKALLGRNLDPSEQMSISGVNGVRAYREVVSGDNGYLIGSALHYTLPGGTFRHEISVFSDLGRVYLEDGSYSSVRGTRLSDAGIGYQAGYRNLYARTEFARTLGPRPEDTGNRDRNRLLLQAGLTF